MSVSVERWVEGRSAAGSLVFVPGFLTEASDHDGWKGPMTVHASARGMAAYVVRWQSMQPLDLFPLFHALHRHAAAVKRWALVAGGAALLVAPGALFGGGIAGLLLGGALLNPVALMPLSTILGLDPSYVYNALVVWKSAVRNADAAGADPSWLRSVPGPVTLVGHSLGGRVALRVAEQGASGVDALVALAPAVAAASIDTPSVVRFARRARTHVVYSAEDQVLSVPFRLGEGTASHAVGYKGPPSAWTGVGRHAVSCGHTEYDGISGRILERLVG